MGKIADDVWPLFVMACGGYTMVPRPISAIEVLITRTYSGLGWRPAAEERRYLACGNSENLNILIRVFHHSP